MTTVKRTLHQLIELFESGNVPEAIAMTMFPTIDVPSTRWSQLNRILQFLSGTRDGRGFRQWNQVGRSVKKGTKAFYILVPLYKHRKKIDEETEEETTIHTLKGFKTMPVFRMEDTEGDPVEYTELALPQIPLLERAETWGVRIVPVSGNSSGCHGYYQPSNKIIALASPEERVFFHELSHAAHERVCGELVGGQQPLQEIVAELSAAALTRLVGLSDTDTTGYSYRYIRHYAEEMDEDPVHACRLVLSDVEKVLQEILSPTDERNTDGNDVRAHDKHAVLL